jgi:hypothetical protein
MRDLVGVTVKDACEGALESVVHSYFRERPVEDLKSISAMSLEVLV